jgi:quercetin dioxygenase-like cupin family protein
VYIERASFEQAKGWCVGPWNVSLSIAVGYANKGINDPHYHDRTTEIYMVARGQVEVRVEQETVRLSQNDVLVIEPGEAHTFLAASPDYFHFVVHSPGLPDGEAQVDKVKVKKARLGL